MRKYWTIFKTEVASMAAFRAHGVIWVLFDILLFIAFPFVLLAIYNENGALGDFNRNQIISYYFIIALYSNFVWLHPETQISFQIREGIFTNYVVKPVNYCFSLFLHEIAWKMARTLLFLPFLIPFVILAKSYLVVPSWEVLPAIILMLVGATAVFYFTAFLVATSAFWLEENSSVLALFWIASGMLSGFYVPIALYPEWLVKIISFTPWYFAVSEPVRAIIDSYDTPKVLAIFGMQLVWVSILYGLYRIIWHFGIKRYSAVGR